MTAADPLSGGAARPEVGGSLHEDHAGDVNFSDLKVSSDEAGKHENHVKNDYGVSAACRVVVTMGATSYTAGDTVTGTVRVECTEAVKGKVR